MSLRLAVLSLLVFFTVTAWSNTIPIATVPVPGACLTASPTAKNQMISEDGSYQLLLVAVVSKKESQQSEPEKKQISTCMQDSAKSMKLSDYTLSDFEIEDKVASTINACLKSANLKLAVKFTTLRRERIRCPSHQN